MELGIKNKSVLVVGIFVVEMMKKAVVYIFIGVASRVRLQKPEQRKNECLLSQTTDQL